MSDGTQQRGGGRTGARRPATALPAEPARVRYRGIRWRKDPDGTIGWYNDDAGGWVRWRPGADAPPLPPRFEADASRVPVPPRVRRAAWRSPYRLVPIVLVVAAVAVGIWQASEDIGNPAAAANREARALIGQCLPRTTPAGQAPAYGTSPVPCPAASAAVRVVSVHTAASTARCPSGDETLQLSYAGVRAPDIECAVPVRRS